ncbi:hypothetical protein HQ576_13210 [bacterium]|nr:hypothetical protein [bacterium]
MAEQERQLPLRRAETAATFVLVVQGIAGLVAWLLGWVSRSAAAQAVAWQMLVGAVVWLSCLMHQRLRRLAEEEAREADALKADQAAEGTSLFEADDAVLLTAQQRRDQFERYFLPGFSVVILAALGVLSWHLLRGLVGVAVAGPVDRTLMTAVVFFGLSFVSFLLAKYTAGLATQTPWRALRPGANYTMSCAATSLLVGAALLCYHFELPIVERVVAYVVSVLLGLLAIEVLALLVMGAYRPRTEGRDARAAHDSRVLGMLTTSSGILRTTADTLDYQFGFNVSETWFYRFMERAIAPLIFFQIVTFYFLTCFVIVDEGEQAIIERFGVPRRAADGRGHVVGPGLHLKLPWPAEIAYKHRVKRVEMLMIGEQLKEDVGGYTWTVSHAEEPFSLLVANRPRGKAAAAATAAQDGTPDVPAVSMLAGTVYVYYYVDNLYDYLYNHKTPERSLDYLCYRELTHYFAKSDFLESLGYRIGHATETLKRTIQEQADEQKLGVRIANVTLRGLHPPTEAGEAFEAVVGAMQGKEAEVWRARRDQVRVVSEAEGGAHRAINEARMYADTRQKLTPAIAARFETQLEAYREAPEVFKHRSLIRSLEIALAEVRKVIKPGWVRHEVLEINLEDMVRGGMLDIEASEIDEGATP